MLDDLLISLKVVCEQILPILGALVLVFLCILLTKLWKLMDSLTNTVNGLDPTLKQVNKSIEKAQVPLDTVVKYSHTLDKVHDKTADAFGKAADFASENIDNIKGYVQDKISSGETVVDLSEAEKIMEEDASHVG